ncbi:CSM1-like protein [Scheffersomyces amazonensis]|uniref:CSM1-like protein n=1 Tax=Scheffersomyces amazonensis TaxID=1078765 RepID=UPI00315C51C5
MAPRTRKVSATPSSGQNTKKDDNSILKSTKSSESKISKKPVVAKTDSQLVRSSPRVRKQPSRLIDDESLISGQSSTPKSTGPKSSTPKSGAKRIQNLISSPSTAVKRKLNLTDSVIEEKDILTVKNSEELISLINNLVHTKQDSIFENYKLKVQKQLDNDHELIKQLNQDLSDKQNIVDNLLNDIEELKSKLSVNGNNKNDINNNSNNHSKIELDSEREFDSIYQSPIRIKKNKPVDLINQKAIQKEFEDIGFTLDMVELLTGLRIINFTEDDEKFYFEVKQSSSNSSDVVYITYKLVISKTFESTAEIDYEPTFLEALEDEYEEDDENELSAVENAKYLKTILPDYLCENLSFPYSTLSQFYSKVSRALHKRSKA